MRSNLFFAACAAALLTAACSTGATTTATQASSTTTIASLPAADTDGDYTDAQLQTFIEARREVTPITRSFSALSDTERTQASQRIQEIMAAQQINPATYDAILQQSQTDQALAMRINDLQVANISDETLRAFVAASAEIQPLATNAATATDEERAQISTQIGAILDRNNLDASLYNALATEAQTDQALAARIAALQTSSSAEAD